MITTVAIKIFLCFSMQTNSNQEIGRYITLTPGPAQLGRLSDVTHSLYCIGPEFELRQRQESKWHSDKRACPLILFMDNFILHSDLHVIDPPIY